MGWRVHWTGCYPICLSEGIRHLYGGVAWSVVLYGAPVWSARRRKLGRWKNGGRSASGRSRMPLGVSREAGSDIDLAPVRRRRYPGSPRKLTKPAEVRLRVPVDSGAHLVRILRWVSKTDPTRVDDDMPPGFRQAYTEECPAKDSERNNLVPGIGRYLPSLVIAAAMLADQKSYWLYSGVIIYVHMLFISVTMRIK